MKPYLREREKETRNSTIAGIALAVGLHVLACVCCAFTGLKYIWPPPQEQTFLIDFTEEEEEPIVRQRQGQQPQAEDVDLTQDIRLVQRSESPHQSENENKTAEAKPDDFGDVETPVPEEEINKNALFPGMSKKDSSLAPHSATKPEAEFKAGHPKGNTSKGTADGEPNAHVKGRSVLGALPKPSYNEQTEGKVVVSIWVDQYGNVTKAVPGAQGTTVNNSKLWAAARAAAMKAHFNQSADAPALQEGTITYVFKLK